MKRLIIIFLLVVIQGCGKSEDKIKHYMESGKSLYEKGNYDKAKIEFKNVVQLDSKRAEAYYHLALIEEKKQNWQGMFANLSQVVRLDPKNNDALLKLGRLNLLTGRQKEALKQVDTVLANSPENLDALALKGAVLVKQGNPDEAMKLAEKVLNQHPDHVDAVSLKTVIYLTKNDTDAALATVENALKAKPDDQTLLLLKLQVHSQSKNLAAVEQDYQDLIKRYPEKFEYTYALVKHYSDVGQQDKAMALLQALIDAHPKDLVPKIVHVDFLMLKKPDQAEKILDTYLAQYPEEMDLYFRKAALAIKLNKLDEARQALSKVIELKPKAKESNNAKIMLAKLALQESDIDQAQSLVKEVLADDGHNEQGLIMKARLDLQKGLYDEAISNLRVVLRDFSNSEEALVLIGQAYLKKNTPELAEEHFRKALSINPANFEALIPVASGMIKNKDIARAEELLQKALAVKPDHPGALQAMAQVKLMQKDWQGTQKMADVIASKPKGASYSKFLGGKISQEQGLYKEAIGQYKEALAISPDLTDALQGMVSSYEALGQLKEMLGYLDGFIAANPNESYPWLLKGQILAKTNQSDEALKIWSQASGKWPKVPEFYESVASLHLEKKETDQEFAIINKGLEIMPEQVRLTLFLASMYEQTEDYDKALKTYETLVEKNPNIDIAVNNLVSLLLDHFNTKENVDKAVTLAKRFERSEQPYFVDSYGWALLNSGKNDEALQVLRDVVKKMPEVPVFRYHLGLAYHKTKNKALALSELEEALNLGKKAGGFAEEKATEELLKAIKSEPSA